MSDIYAIDTPENIEFAYDIAGIGSRFLAAMIDTFLILIAQGIILFVAGLAVSSFEIGQSILTALAAVVGFVILWGYYIVFEMVWSGQTPGKRSVGLRVVREGGRPITFVASAIRNFIRLVDFLPALYGIGVVAMFIDTRARRLGDLAAGTLVVKERANVTLESLEAKPFQPANTASGQPLQLTISNINLLNDQDYMLVQEFLRRRTELGREARQRLGMQLASGLQARLGLPQGGDIEGFLQYVVTEYQIYRQQVEASRG